MTEFGFTKIHEFSFIQFPTNRSYRMDPVSLAFGAAALAAVTAAIGTVTGAVNLVTVAWPSLVSFSRGIRSLFRKKPKARNETVSMIREHVESLCPPDAVADSSVSQAKGEQAEAEQQVSPQRAAELLKAELAASKRLAEEEIAGLKLIIDEDRAASQRREQAALKQAQDARSRLSRGIQPIELPSKKQYESAKKDIKYDPEKCHFAVCGMSGSGKSSLVNAFRGLRYRKRNKDKREAETGVVETTSKIGRFPDPHSDLPFNRFVWYDIPGAGTLTVPDWQYFNDQGLFIFDFIVLVYDVRFTKVDAGIIENCYRYRIPVFVVRSKADQHLANMAKAEGFKRGDDEYEDILTTFISETRSNFSKQIEMMKKESEKREKELDKSDSQYVMERQFESAYRVWLSKQIVYIVSDGQLCVWAKRLRASLSSDLTNQTISPSDDGDSIDELALLAAMLEVAALRRYSTSDIGEEKSLTMTMTIPASAMFGS